MVDIQTESSFAVCACVALKKGDAAGLPEANLL